MQVKLFAAVFFVFAAFPALAAPLPFEELLYKGTAFSYYGAPADAQQERLAGLLQKGSMAERMAAIARTLRLKHNLNVGFESCGSPNAYFRPSTVSVVLCYEMVDLIVRTAKADPGFAGPPEQPGFDRLVTSVIVAIYLHELGHALIGINGVPFTGREEDVADQFFMYVAAQNLEPRGARVVLAAAWFFKALSKQRDLTQSGELSQVLADEHSLDMQRTFNLACWAVGTGQEWGLIPAAYVGLPQQRAVRCGEEFAKLNQGIGTRFRRYLKPAAS